MGANGTSRHPDQLKSNPCIKKLESGQSLRRLCLSFPHDKHGSIRSEFLSESRVCFPFLPGKSPQKGRKTSTKLPASPALSSRGTGSTKRHRGELLGLGRSQLLRTPVSLVHFPAQKSVCIAEVAEKGFFSDVLRNLKRRKTTQGLGDANSHVGHQAQSQLRKSERKIEKKLFAERR